MSKNKPKKLALRNEQAVISQAKRKRLDTLIKGVERNVSMINLAAEWDEAEHDLYTIITVCTYIAVEGVPAEILRIQLEQIDVHLDMRLEHYKGLIETSGHLAAEIHKDFRRWVRLGEQVTDIGNGIKAALDPDNPDNGAALRAACWKHATPEHRRRLEAIRQEVKRRERERQQAKEAEIGAAVRNEQLRSLTPDQLEAMRVKGLIKWGIEQIKSSQQLGAKKNSQAAKTLLDRLDIANKRNSISQTDETAVLLDLKTRLEGTRPHASIAEVMEDKIAAVEWDKVTIIL